MRLYTQTHNKLSLIVAEGIIDRNAFIRIQDLLQQLPASQQKQVWINCASLQQIIKANFGFSTFVSELLLIRAQQADVLLVGLDKTSCRLLDLLQLNQCFRLAPSPDEAYLLLHQKQAAA